MSRSKDQNPAQQWVNGLDDCSNLKKNRVCAMKTDIQELPLGCISISYRQATASVRAQVAFDETAQRTLLEEIKQDGRFDGAVLLVTCNRTELYLACRRHDLAQAERLLAGKQDVRTLRPYFRTYCGTDALTHLFHVASGLDSMVLGEDEILGQLRRAYTCAVEMGCAGGGLHLAFQRAMACAKQIKTDTCLSKTSISTATLCAKEVQRFVKENILPKNQSDTAVVLLIGASGEIGSLVAKDLKNADVHIYATVRRHQAALHAPYLTEIPYEERYMYLDRADVVISATSSPHYTFTFAACSRHFTEAKPRLMIDLAVPCDLDPDLTQLAGVHLLTIDDFTALASAHNAQKQDGAAQAEQMIADAACQTQKEYLYHTFLQRHPETEEKLQKTGFAGCFHAMKQEANAEEFAMLLHVIERMLTK